MVGLPYCVGPPGFPPQRDHLSKFHYSIVQAKRCEKARGERNRKKEAKERLRHAIELDKEARKLALEDEDLKPPWDWIGGLK